MKFNSPSFFPSHFQIGKAETLLCLARNSFEAGFLNQGETHCQKVINTIEKSLLVREDLALQYDILSCCNLLLINHMSEMSGDDRINTILIGIKNTNRALAINCDSQYYWHHLGIFYWHLYQATGEQRNQLKAVQAILNSIRLNPRNSNVWNTLGVIAGDHLSVSQHCLLKSIKLCSATTEMQWSNLGVVYMKDAALCVNLEDDLTFRAHKCFNESQAQNPNYVNGWVGQALIAENVNHSSTLDLLRHCNALKYHPVPTIRFAYHLLLDTNQPANQTDLLNLAIDNMRIYSQKKANDPLALNLLGCLYERSGYRRTAYGLFERALQHSRTEYAKELIQINYLRNAAYYKRPDDLRLVMDEQLYKTDWHPATYLCLANLRDGRYEEASACLEHALSLVDSGSYLCFLINSLQYLLAERLQRPADARFNTEMIQTNEPLRTVFIVQLMLSRSYSPALKALIDVILIQPNLIDMLLISTFTAAEQPVNFAQDFQGLPQTWIKQALDYLISPTANAKDDLKEFNRIYRNFISCQTVKPKQLVGYHILLSLNLVESENEDCLRKCLMNMQTAYYLMPFDSTVRRLFESIRRITGKELASRSLLDELGMSLNEFLVFVLEFLQ